MKYAFVLGLNNELSKLEIFTVLKKEKINFDIIVISKEILLLELDKEIDGVSFIKKLGGTIKIIQIQNSYIKFNQEKIETSYLSYLINQKNVKENLKEKVNYGFSLYLGDENLNDRSLKSIFKRISLMGMRLKGYLKNKEIVARFVTSKERFLSSVIVKKNKLILSGGDFCIILCKKNIFIGVTLAIQDFENYSKLDYGRPGRDDKSGMLPPKLSQMMINLACVKESDFILDPFCGSGTILTQAMLLGYQNIYGSDKSQDATQDTKENIKWINSKNELAIPEITTVDICKISKSIQQNSIDAIITEPYLGLPIKKQDKFDFNYINSRKKEIKVLEELYYLAFVEFKKILKQNGRVVIIFPIYNFSQNEKIQIQVQIIEKIEKLGFKRANNFKEYINYTKRGSIIYGREGQFVFREIFIFEVT